MKCRRLCKNCVPTQTGACRRSNGEWELVRSAQLDCCLVWQAHLERLCSGATTYMRIYSAWVKGPLRYAASSCRVCLYLVVIAYTPVVQQWLSLLIPQVFKFGCYIAIPIFMTAAFVTNPDRLAAIIKNVSLLAFLFPVPESLV